MIYPLNPPNGGLNNSLVPQLGGGGVKNLGGFGGEKYGK